MNFFPPLLVTDLKQQCAAAFLFLFPTPKAVADSRARCRHVLVLRWLLGSHLALEGERHIQTSGAMQPNCLALVQLLIDPINSNESGFLQSDLLPLPVMCLSQSMKS